MENLNRKGAFSARILRSNEGPTARKTGTSLEFSMPFQDVFDAFLTNRGKLLS
jgi:hypothetical protein